MVTAEGRGLARGRWRAFQTSLPKDVQQAAYGSSFGEALDAEMQARLAKQARERAELIGFWIAWHEAGGFENLEASGWHRTTIFRKVRRFRDYFGAHPDEYEFPWVTLDLHKVWMNDLLKALDNPSADPSF